MIKLIVILASKEGEVRDVPVKVVSKKDKKGYPIVEKSTGRVVAHGKTKKNAYISAWIRNKAIEEKKEGK